jgi:predicted membrane chloride channel (bestrophin family)
LLSRTGKRLTARKRRLWKIRRVTLQVVMLCIIKMVAHTAGLDLITITPLFSATVASTVFLLGFLLSGVLTDYKESEKIPGEMATALESLSLEIRAITTYHPNASVDRALVSVCELGEALLDWLREGLNTEQLLGTYRRVHGDVVRAAVQLRGDGSTLRGRLMQDLSVLLQRINRVKTIRDTKFVPLVYWMADIAAILLFAGLVMAKTANLAESVFFLAVIAFIIILLLCLIDDIDNPFGLGHPDSAENVSIDLLEQAVHRLKSSLSGERT